MKIVALLTREGMAVGQATLESCPARARLVAIPRRELDACSVPSVPALECSAQVTGQ